MHNRELIYWLNGFFEIGEPADLTIKQAKIIRSHLHLVWEVDKEFWPFNMWLTGVLDTLEASGVLELSEEMQIEPRLCALIKSRISEVFLHVIDKSYGGDTEKQQEIHDSYKKEKDNKGDNSLLGKHVEFSVTSDDFSSLHGFGTVIYAGKPFDYKEFPVENWLSITDRDIAYDSIKACVVAGCHKAPFSWSDRFTDKTTVVVAREDKTQRIIFARLSQVIVK